jgi:hypothetical protein
MRAGCRAPPPAVDLRPARRGAPVSPTPTALARQCAEGPSPRAPEAGRIFRLAHASRREGRPTLPAAVAPQTPTLVPRLGQAIVHRRSRTSRGAPALPPRAGSGSPGQQGRGPAPDRHVARMSFPALRVAGLESDRHGQAAGRTDDAAPRRPAPSPTRRPSRVRRSCLTRPRSHARAALSFRRRPHPEAPARGSVQLEPR